MIKYFYLDAVPNSLNYIVKLNFDEVDVGAPSEGMGSYAILQARLMNLDWVDFLRFCRDELGAKLVGKDSLYPIIYFNDSAIVRDYVKLLNKRMDLVMRERELSTEELKKKIKELKNQ